MKAITQGPVELGWLSSRVGPAGTSLTLVLKGTFSLCPDTVVKPAPEQQSLSGSVLSDCEGQELLKYPSDFVPFKLVADILLLGTAHAPAGRPVTHLDVALRVGAFKKALRVSGDRSWRRRFLLWSTPSAPVAFDSMPIAYHRAYGGKRFKKNPAGVGHDGKRLPNLQSQAFPIRRRRDRPSPACFGPISPDWEPRRSKVGTYKDKWAKERWPWFPDNFNWSYFNAAPEDQQVEGYLRGDEDLELQNLHPAHPLYRSRLPGLRARAFVEIHLPGAQPEFREVRMNLDTLWIDMNEEKLVLVWRGLTPVQSVKFKEVSHIAALTEPLASPIRPKEEMREWMLQRIREEMGGGPPTTEQAAEAAAAKASREALENDMAAMDQEGADLEKEFATVEQEAASQEEQAKGQLAALGVDPKTLEKPPRDQNTEEIKAALAADIARLAETSPQKAAELTDALTGLNEIGEMEKEFAALEAPGPPPPTRDSVQQALAQGKPLSGVQFSGLDFSSLEVSRADLSAADFSKANLSNAKLVNCKLKGANFSQADLTGADFTQSVLDGADFSKAKLRGAKFSGTSIEGALFADQQLQGLDFSDCRGQHPNFSSSNLERANFAGAKIPQADFCRANVTGASFIQAELPSADFGGASAAGINMESADLTNLRAGEKANFEGGRFCEAKAPKSIWEGAVLDQADFSRAALTGALFEDASVKGARFDRADLTKASFEDASAQRAVMTNANLLRASFNRADLTEARLDGSNLYEASFWETVFRRTNIDGANIKRTLIS